MFSIFRTDGGLDEVDAVRFSDPPFSNDCENTFFQRSACDLCRTQEHECQGPHETCNRCLATSSACTYTLSSGKGPGKKRLRKTSMAHPGIRMSRSSYQSPRSSTSSSVLRQQNTTAPNSRDPPNVSSIASSSEGATDMLQSFGDTAWDFAIDDPFTSLGAMAPSQDMGDASDSHGQGSRRDSVRLPPLLTLCPSPWSRPSTSQDTGSSLTIDSSGSGGAPCPCLSTMLGLLEMVGARVSVLKDEETEDLFTCLGRATDQGREMVHCTLCYVLAKNPVMVANLSRQLLAVTQEIVSRLQSARQGYNVAMSMGASPLPLSLSLPHHPVTAPSSLNSSAEVPATPIGVITFQYGRYTVEKRQVNARLLQMLIRCHVDEVRELIGEFRRSCLQATSAVPISAATMLEDAQRLAENLVLVVG